MLSYFRLEQKNNFNLTQFYARKNVALCMNQTFDISGITVELVTDYPALAEYPVYSLPPRPDIRPIPLFYLLNTLNLSEHIFEIF